MDDVRTDLVTVPPLAELHREEICLEPIPIEALFKLLEMRPDWRWSFRLVGSGRKLPPELDVTIEYECPCAARERLYTRHAVPYIAVACAPERGGIDNFVFQLTYTLTKMTDRHIEAHTAKWRRVPLLINHFDERPGALTQRDIEVAMGLRRPPYALPREPLRCRKCKRPLGAECLQRMPGILSALYKREPELWCVECGQREQEEH